MHAMAGLACQPGRRAAAALALLCLALALAAAQPQAEPAAPRVAEFGASIFLGGPWDWERTGAGGRSRCQEMVDRVKQNNIHYVQFVPTLYWYDTGPRAPLPAGFDPSCSGGDLSSYYCFNRFNATTVDHWCYVRYDNGTCPEVTQREIDAFRDDVGACMAYAADRGLNLAVNSRVDDGRRLGGWRNTLDFSPTQRYGKFSYEEAVLDPLADALAGALRPGTQVSFIPQGEMGATVYFHPGDWAALVPRLRERIRGGRDNQVLIGLGANNNKACGCLGIGIVDGYKYLDFLDQSFDASLYNLSSIKDAYIAADFIGISAYIPMPKPQFDVCELEGLLKRMDRELAHYNLSVKQLTDQYGKEVHYSEYGVGGGTNNDGAQPALTAQAAAETPFFGSGGAYTCAKDPFQMCTPDVPNEVRDYRRYFFSQSAEYFKRDGCTYHGVKVAYIWGTGSWDVLAIYPGDVTPEGSYTDPVVVATINRHNAYAQQVAAGIKVVAPAPEVVPLVDSSQVKTAAPPPVDG